MKKLIHFLSLAWSVSPAYIILLVINALLGSAKTLLNIVLPMYLIDELTGAKDIKLLCLYGGFIVLNNVGMMFLTNTLQRFLKVKEEQTHDGMNKLMSEKIMNLEYSYLEDPYYLDLKERAVFTVQNQNAISNLIVSLADLISRGATLIGLIVILVSLGPVLLIVLLIGLTIMLGIYAGVSKYQTQIMQEIIPTNRKYSYYINVVLEKEAQKDVRLYKMEDMLADRIVGFSNEVCDMFERVQIKFGKAMGQMGAVGEGVAAFSYGYVGLRTISDKFGPQLSLGELTMYVSAAINFSSMVVQFGESVVSMIQFLSWLDPYMEFMSLAEETQSTGKIPFEGAVETVEFRNVTFTYPKAEKAVLQNVSFSIKKGEKISIVGLNGAGKSTLVKLICRMYQADSGEILINGRNIYDYEYLSYMNTISAVFQDYRLFNFTIAENISCQEKDADVAEVNRLVYEVGLEEKVKELPLGIESRFGKEYDEEGIEMSGGQAQKIAIARALYKKASMVILDEPASALDPIAEAEIYEKFNSLVEDKTAIYISHRMSSSVFCDKILIIDDGTVADFDTHENLMQKTESLYYKLFMSQAENYKLCES
ncbi:MAG: ABC transporter ATP-binding protein [Agathobacter sp.]|nr:ABC transporter ATP-binding protein [Agathobacter sp.]